MPAAGLDIVLSRKSVKCRFVIEENILSRVGIQRELFSKASKIAVISDDNVAKLYARSLKSQLSKFAPTSVITFAHGERSKTLRTCDELASQLSALGLDRKSMIISLGGGVVGDVAGFVASIFKRGIEYVQAPTTLLAQVDSSIGGKTGVDTEWGKNQLGSFYQPRAVLIDTALLKTLPDQEIINGLAEMVKSGIIADAKLFRSLEGLESFDMGSLKELIPRTCRIKMGIVGRDQYEENLRSVLNYGHTVGHAIEAASNFRLSHGKSVILGMVAEGWIAEKMGLFSRQAHEIQRTFLRRVSRSFRIHPNVDSQKIVQFAKLDKKSAGSTIRMALPERIGKMYSTNRQYLVPVTREIILKSIDYLQDEIQ